MPVEDQSVETSSQSTEPKYSNSNSTTTATSNDNVSACQTSDSVTSNKNLDDFPSEFVENGSETHRLSSSMLDFSLEDSQLFDSGNGNSPLCNTLDDISSLKTIEESTSPVQNEGDVMNECDIGQIEEHLAPSSLKEPLERSDDPQVTDKQEMDDVNEDGWMDVIGSGDLMKRIIRKGKGIHTRPQRGNVATINISGRLEDGQEVDSETNKDVIVGDADVIQGLDLAIPLMELDEISEIAIKPRLGYGKLGREPDIPPHATITYTVELVAVGDELNPETLSRAERKRIGDMKREKGNFWYTRGEYSCALQCYRKALDFLDDASTNFSDGTEEQRVLAEMWIKVSNNMAAAQLKIGAFEAALKSVENVIRVQPKNVKALFRKGKILASMGKTNEAIEIMKEALKIEPETKVIHQELASLIAKQKTEVNTERELYKRMLGQDKQPTSVKPSSTNSFMKWGFLVGGLTAAFLSIVAYRHFHMGSVD